MEIQTKHESRTEGEIYNQEKLQQFLNVSGGKTRRKNGNSKLKRGFELVDTSAH